MKEIWPQLRERWKGALKRYQYVLLVMAAGVLLMMLPMGPSGGSEEAQGPPEGEGQFDLELFEEKLSQVLSDIQGAGKTRVVLTLKSGSRQILAQNVERDGERSASAVTVGQGAGTDVYKRQLHPDAPVSGGAGGLSRRGRPGGPAAAAGGGLGPHRPGQRPHLHL